MRVGKLLLAGMMAVLVLGGALSPSAYAKRHKIHAAKVPKYHYKPDKNAYLFGGKHQTPKAQKHWKGTFHNTGTGDAAGGKR